MDSKIHDLIQAALWGVVVTILFFGALSLPSAFPVLAAFIGSTFPYICVWFLASLLILITFFRG